MKNSWKPTETQWDKKDFETTICNICDPIRCEEKLSYVSKSIDRDRISSRLADEWKPDNLGTLGRLLRKFIVRMRLGKIRFRINLFGGKVYLAKPTVTKRRIWHHVLLNTPAVPF